MKQMVVRVGMFLLCNLDLHGVIHYIRYLMLLYIYCSYCLPNSLDKEKIKGKIVLCDYGPAQDTSDNGDGAIEGGAVGVILTSDQLSEQLSQSDYHFPVATVGLEENSNIYNYINQTR